MVISRGVVKSSSGESLPASAIPSSHPYKIPQAPPPIAKYDPDFPLRKTGRVPAQTLLTIIIDQCQRLLITLHAIPIVAIIFFYVRSKIIKLINLRVVFLSKK